MATAQPIVPRKEGWLGVALTALGCALFLVWWFWPRDDDDALTRARQATPDNFLLAAQEKRTADNSAALDVELLVLALQASVLGDDWMVKKTTETMVDSVWQDFVVEFGRREEPTDSTGIPAVGAIDALLQEDKVDVALESAAALEGDARVHAMLGIATFLTQSGRLEQARELIDKHVSQLSADAVDLHLQLADLFGQWGDFDGAEAAVKAAAAGANSTANQLAAAKQCYSLNLFEEGLKLMERAEQSVAGDPASEQEVIETYLQMGETEKARAFSEISGGTKDDEASVVLAVELALAGWEEAAFAEALQQWRLLKSDAAKAEAAQIMREYFNVQLAASEAPPLIRKPVASGESISATDLSALQKVVDNGQPELAADAIEAWMDPSVRSSGYVILARLLLWRYARTAGTGL